MSVAEEFRPVPRLAMRQLMDLVARNEDRLLMGGVVVLISALLGVALSANLASLGHNGVCYQHAPSLLGFSVLTMH